MLLETVADYEFAASMRSIADSLETIAKAKEITKKEARKISPEDIRNIPDSELFNMLSDSQKKYLYQNLKERNG